jgi:hypothetical protein
VNGGADRGGDRDGQQRHHDSQRHYQFLELIGAT